MGRQDHRLGSLLQGVLDGRQGGNDASRVGDGSGLLVLRAVEVHPGRKQIWVMSGQGILKGESITVLLTSCLTVLELAV